MHLSIYRNNSVTYLYTPPSPFAKTYNFEVEEVYCWHSQWELPLFSGRQDTVISRIKVSHQLDSIAECLTIDQPSSVYLWGSTEHQGEDNQNKEGHLHLELNQMKTYQHTVICCKFQQIRFLRDFNSEFWYTLLVLDLHFRWI